MGQYKPRALAYRVNREDRIRTIDDIIKAYGKKKAVLANVFHHPMNCTCESCYKGVSK